MKKPKSKTAKKPVVRKTQVKKVAPAKAKTASMAKKMHAAIKKGAAAPIKAKTASTAKKMHSKKPKVKPVILSLTRVKSATPKKSTPIVKKVAASVCHSNVYQWTSEMAGTTMDFVVAAKTPVEALGYAGIPREKAWYLDECIHSKLREMAMNKPGTVFVRDLSMHYYEEWKPCPGYTPKAPDEK